MENKSEETKPEEKLEEKSEELEKVEKKNKRKLPVGVRKPAIFEDGSYREYEYDFPTLQENVEYNRIVSMLGLESHEEATYRNEIGEIGRLVYSWLGETDEAEAFKFIKSQLRRIPSGGSKVMNLLRQLKISWKEARES